MPALIDGNPLVILTGETVIRLNMPELLPGIALGQNQEGGAFAANDQNTLPGSNPDRWILAAARPRIAFIQDPRELAGL